MSQAITDELTYAAARAASSNTDDADARTVMLAVLGCAQAWVGDMRLIGNVRASDIVRALSAALSAGQAQPVRWMLQETLPSGSIKWSVYEHEHHAQSVADNLPDCVVIPLYASPTAVPEEVVSQAACRLTQQIAAIPTKNIGQHERDIRTLIAAISVPLPEIEGGDKGDGWQPSDTAPVYPCAWMVRENELDGWDFVRLKLAADDLIARGFEVIPLYAELPAAPSASIGETP